MGPAPPLPPLARPAFSLAWGFLDGLGCPSNQGYLARAIAAMSNLVRPSDWPVEVVAAAAAATAAPSAAEQRLLLRLLLLQQQLLLHSSSSTHRRATRTHGSGFQALQPMVRLLRCRCARPIV
eukprot:CAMPEP_0206525074 /NCGR_PEP_ID=MMETSP0324_2-20121206/68535_1 /ASSEMBLY_ACC=CAM_ASM_000836 /TAXON_ID=2866 /ORGANISM="Crypthecodinium cohnii, Strain Seligo" /LENGTH=122 /DNA_ID=CAMNT_0054019707 /DNA_START=615 /DNA_END=983 /DNA_ORIENTATION=+